jgi:hypothetical protein
MKVEDIVIDDSHSDFVEKTKECFLAAGIDFAKPYFTKVKDLHTGAAGKHTGLYFIFQKTPDSPEGYIYYYTGIATKGNSVHKRFQPHYAKLTVNLPAMYGKLDRISKETQWQFPKNWRAGVKQHFLNNTDDIPDYWEGKQRRDILKPANHDWKPEFKVNVDALDVMVFNLATATPKQIDDLETAFIGVFRPVFNGAKTKNTQ